MQARLLRVNIPAGTSGLVQASAVIIDQVRAIDYRRLEHKIGTLPEEIGTSFKKNPRLILDLDVNVGLGNRTRKNADRADFWWAALSSRTPLIVGIGRGRTRVERILTGVWLAPNERIIRLPPNTRVASRV